MLTKSTLIAAVAVATISIASPALAQAPSNGWGTGNVMPSYYDSDGSLHMGAAPSERNARIALRRNGQNASAQARQASPRELKEFREGDYYAPSGTVVQQPTPQERREAREGDFYAPTVN
jgi:hypothetical protein